MEREEPIYKNGLYITVSDQTAFEHYHKLHANSGTHHLPDEKLRRYRFSVVVNKLTETLYRLRYELEKEGKFGSQVKICTTAGEPGEDTVSKSLIARRCSETHILILLDEPSRRIRCVYRAKL